MKDSHAVADQSYGKFKSFGDFLESYRTAERSERITELAELSPQQAQASLSNRDVVEVNATVAVKEPDDSDSHGGRHQRFLIRVTSVLMSNSRVTSDVTSALTTGDSVFVAVRFGDNQGLSSPIPGLVVGVTLHLKGEWITKAKATAHGGKKMPVLHFTHHPLGFVCTPSKCFS
jgi:endonuclease G